MTSAFVDKCIDELHHSGRGCGTDALWEEAHKGAQNPDVWISMVSKRRVVDGTGRRCLGNRPWWESGGAALWLVVEELIARHVGSRMVCWAYAHEISIRPNEPSLNRRLSLDPLVTAGGFRQKW